MNIRPVFMVPPPTYPLTLSTAGSALMILTICNSVLFMA